MAKLYNLARMTTATVGTGTITLDSAATGYLSFADAGVQNNDTVTYAISDGANSEIGRGVYTAVGTTLTRTVLKSTNAGNPISLSGIAQVFITISAEEIISADGRAGGQTLVGGTAAGENLILNPTSNATKGGVLPAANDGGALGASGTAWSDLFLASGGVINFAAGDVTITHSSGTMTCSGMVATTTASVTQYIDVAEMAAPAAPSANVARIFARDVTGETQLAFVNAAGTTVDLFRGIVNAEDFGASPSASAAVNTAAIQAAIDWCESLGGGRVHIGKGSYSITNINAPAANWDDDVALVVEADNIHIEGDGPGTTKLVLANSSDCHVIKLGRRVVSSTPVDDCSVSNLTIDGNRANQTAPTATDYHWDGINVATGSTRIILENLHIHDTQHYGIGFERGTFVNCTIKNVSIYNTGADGIDFKNDSSLNFGNIFTGIRVESFGLAGVLSTDQAGIDIYGGVHVNGATITNFGPTQGKCGIRFQSDSGGITQSSAASLENFYIEADDSASTMGVRLNNHSGRVANGAIYDCATGFQIQQRENAVSNIFVESCATGFEFNDGGGATATSCERNVLTGCVARSNTGRGFWIVAESQNALIGCVSRTNDVGIDIDAGASDTLIIGCTVDNNVTSEIVDDGTRTTIIMPSSVKLGADILPSTDDGAAIGSTTKRWSDLFLAEGGVINWDNGDFTATQTNNLLDFAGGSVSVGGFTAQPTTSGGTVSPVLNASGVGSLAGYAFSADSNPTIVTLAKSRHATVGSHTVVQASDSIGDIRFEGSDGTNFIRAGHIRAIVDGTPGSNDMPGRIEIATTPDGAATPVAHLRVNSSGSVIALSATGGLGYGAGAGGAVTQITSRTTGVTLNTVCGAITLVSAAGTTTWQTFTVTNSAVTATDNVHVSQKSGTDLNEIHVTAIGSGTFNITFRTTGGTTTEQPVFKFTVIKAVEA